jgi:peptide-methionine (R)-S-oxide reductase
MQSTLIASLAAAAAGIVLASCALGQDVKYPGVATSSPKRADKVVLTESQWKKKLTPEQYKILREEGTEPAFCGVNLAQKGPGVYHCVGCNLPLFTASTKFDSGTGWPSFYKPISLDSIWFQKDTTFGMVRTEVLCSKCDGHLGHVFDDGPEPTKLRFCMNGKVLKFVPKK